MARLSHDPVPAGHAEGRAVRRPERNGKAWPLRCPRVVWTWAASERRGSAQSDSVLDVSSVRTVDAHERNVVLAVAGRHLLWAVRAPWCADDRKDSL